MSTHRLCTKGRWTNSSLSTKKLQNSARDARVLASNKKKHSTNLQTRIASDTTIKETKLSGSRTVLKQTLSMPHLFVLTRARIPSPQSQFGLKLDTVRPTVLPIQQHQTIHSFRLADVSTPKKKFMGL